MNRFRFLTLLAVVVASMFAAGCGKLTSSGFGASSGGGSTPAIQILNLRTKLSWEDQDVFTDFDYDTGSDCQITEGVDALGAAKTCSVTVPELQLFFSDIKFQIDLLALADGTDACAVVNYQPYYYQATDDVAFVPDWATTSTEDCSLAPPLAANCFNGPAKVVIAAAGSSFPTYTGLYFVAAGQTSNTYDISSANSTDPNLTNRWTTNDFLTGRPTIALGTMSAGDGYLTGTKQDWRWTCQDSHAFTNYSFTLTIIDDDGAVNDYDDWKPY